MSNNKNKKKNNNKTQNNKINDNNNKQKQIKKEIIDKDIQENTEEIVSKSTIIGSIITVIVAFIIIGVIGFFIYDNFIKINNPNNMTKKLDKKEIDKLGMEKFNWLKDQYTVNEHILLFFTNNNILDINNIDNNEVLAVGYKEIDSDNKITSGDSNTSCMTEEQYPNNCYKETFDKNILKEQINKYFSDKLNVNYTSFIPSSSKYCTEMNNNYECILKLSDYRINKLFIITSFYEAEIVNNNLIVYSGLISAKRDNDGVIEEERGVYSDVSGNNKIDDLTYFNQVTKEGYSNEINKELMNHYKDKATKYKTTFELINNNYVWLKTEKI